MRALFLRNVVRLPPFVYNIRRSWENFNYSLKQRVRTPLRQLVNKALIAR